MELQSHPKVSSQWPPPTAGTATRGMEFLQAQDLTDRLEEVFYYAPVNRAEAAVVLRTRWHGNEYSRHLYISDRTFAEQLANLLKGLKGKAISEIAHSDVSF